MFKGIEVRGAEEFFSEITAATQMFLFDEARHGENEPAALL